MTRYRNHGEEIAAAQSGKWDWRSQPLDRMSLPQIALLADEGNPEAKALYEEWKINEAQRRPVAERLDRYGRTKTTGAW